MAVISLKSPRDLIGLACQNLILIAARQTLIQGPAPTTMTIATLQELKCFYIKNKKGQFFSVAVIAPGLEF